MEKSRIGPRDGLPKLSIVLSPELPDLYVCLIGFAAELQEGTTPKIHYEGSNESPIPEGAFPNGKPRRFCYVTPKFAGGKRLTEDSNLPSIYRRPARAAFVRGPGGETPSGRANPKTPPRLVASKIPSPEGLKKFGWLARRGGGFRLGGVPKGKWMGSVSLNLRSLQARFWRFKGGTSPLSGFGDNVPEERGGPGRP